MRKPLKLSAAAAILALALTGCGQHAMDSIDYTDKGVDKAPEVSFQTPFKVDDATTKVLKQGDGADVDPGDTVIVNAALYNGEDGKEVQDTYQSQQPMTVVLNDDVKDKLPELYDALVNAKVGTTFAFAQAPDASKTGSKDASVLEVYTVSEKILDHAEGDEVKDLPSGLPSVKIEDDGPKITIPKDTEQPTELTAQNLINGSGTEVKATDTVYVKYAGVKWSDGKQFDSNWTKDPTSFALDQVITGWKNGLKGKHVGDRVELVVPADQAYGTDEEVKGTKNPGGALVFVVDILGTQPTPQQATPSPSPSGQASSAPASAAPSASTENK